MRELTKAVCPSLIIGEITFGLCLTGSQLSPHILIELPLPILQTAPFLMTSLPLSMLFHAYDALGRFFASIAEELGKNIALKTSKTKIVYHEVNTGLFC